MLRALLVTMAVLGTGIVRAEYTAKPLTTVAMSTVLADAQKLADARPGSVLVVKKIDPAKLRTGMVVVYTNRFGETVAHRLVATTAGGWTAQGYNNSKPDSTVVNGVNLVGVVYATFHSSGLWGSVDLAAVAGSIPAAFAAPAR